MGRIVKIRAAESSGLKEGSATLLTDGGVAAAVLGAIGRISANSDAEGTPCC